MENEEILKSLVTHEEKIKAANRRIADLEEQQKQIQNLTMSVQELAMSVKNMVEVQKKQGEELAELKSRPTQNWNTMTRTAFTTIVSAIAGALSLAIINSIVPFL